MKKYISKDIWISLIVIYVVLIDAGINCAVYHADLGQKLRREVHEKFVKDIIPVIVATVAFGMGIDKPGVLSITLIKIYFFHCCLF